MSVPVVNEEFVADLKATIAKVMDVDPVQIQGHTRFVEDLMMDSLAALGIMLELERKYGMKIAREDYKHLGSLDTVVAFIESKKASR